MREADAVREFHEVFGVGVRSRPSLPPDRTQLRLALLEEEVAEVREAIESGDVASVAKELADLLYVTHGAALEFGIPLEDVFERVHRSNMSKLWSLEEASAALADEANPADHSESVPGGFVVRRVDGKVLKPPSFEAPDLGDLTAP